MKKILLLSAAIALAACEPSSSDGEGKAANSTPDPDFVAFPSTYEVPASPSTLIRNARVYDGIGGVIESGDVLIVDGRIAAIGESVEQDADVIIDAEGKVVTPGIIDIHSHLGNYPSPSIRAHGDGNEATSPITSEVDAEHGVWPQDPGFDEALQGGVTTLHILPGSANLFGGKGVTLRNVSARTVQGMKMPGAPETLKMACGENPKRVYGDKGGPASRMGNVAGYRKNWIKAQDYDPSKGRDLQLETLKGVLDGEILVQMHCYRADEMAQIMDIAKEFGYKVTTFHHAIESYKIGDLLAENDVCSAMWADWYGFKAEAYDTIRENIPFVHAQGACAMIHSDDDKGIQRLNQEVAKAWADGNRAGLDIPKAEAMMWMTANPARGLGIFDQTGSLEEGKRADVVIWSGDPFSTYSRPEKVMVDGALLFDRETGLKPQSDFRVGQDSLPGGSILGEAGQ